MHTQAGQTDWRYRSAEPRNLQAHQICDLELAALRLISEQVALPVDQLARLLKRRLGDAMRLVAALEDKGCLLSRQFFVDDFSWTWLTYRGARLAGIGYKHLAKPPSIELLGHRRAVVEVRLLLRQLAPQGRWISEREVRRHRGWNAQIPDAVFEVDGERHAVEVELSHKSTSRLREIIADNIARHDAVLYFCGPESRHQLKRLKRVESWPSLIVRDLPGLPVSSEAQRPRLDPARQPHGREIQILQLIAEQGAVPFDQLVRFLRRHPEQVHGIATQLASANFVRYEEFLADQPSWLWLTEAGARLSGTGMRPLRKRPGGLPLLRALNEIRLLVSGRSPTARWISRRMLLRQFGQYETLPGAVVEQDGQCHAINVGLRQEPRSEGLIPRLDLHNARYDAVIYFCVNPQVRRFMERLQQECRWSKLVIRDLPQSAPGFVEVGRTRICGTRSVR